jgi:hypothetical protein
VEQGSILRTIRQVRRFRHSLRCRYRPRQTPPGHLAESEPNGPDGGGNQTRRSHVYTVRRGGTIDAVSMPQLTRFLLVWDHYVHGRSSNDFCTVGTFEGVGMRFIRFAVAVIFVFAAGKAFAQQRGGGAGGGGAQAPRQLSPEMLAEQQLQEAQHQIQAVQPGRGAQGQQATPDESDPDTYINRTDLFSVSVPCKFTVKDIIWDTEYDSKVPGHVYSCKDGDTDYEMSVINYTDIEKIRAAQEHTDAASGGMYGKIDVYASVDYAATKLRNEAAKVTYDAYHYMNYVSGHELQYNLPNGKRVYAGIYLHEYRLYIMKATAPPNGIPPLLYTQSFAVVRTDGSPIRYQAIYRHPW